MYQILTHRTLSTYSVVLGLTLSDFWQQSHEKTSLNCLCIFLNIFVNVVLYVIHELK